MTTINTQKITPFLWFNGNAEDAMNFYVSVFKNAKAGEVMRMGTDGPVMSVTFELEGQPFFALNGGPMFTFTEAVSFFVSCDTQEEIDHFWERLCEGGAPSRCGWLKDKFGLSWQIVPPVLSKLLNDKDPVKSRNVMEAMMKMDKLIIRDLEDAYNKA
jgi:predicted 3-demethylubiquinone-9 3-methyltransferase (glyoxalase superfamily)